MVLRKSTLDGIATKIRTYSKDMIDPLDENIIIAGGFVRAFKAYEDINDMDCYFKTEDALQSYRVKFDESKDWTLDYDTNQAYTYKNKRKTKKIQLIKPIFLNIVSIFASFDFTMCQIAYYQEDIYTHPETLRDIQNKQLKYTSSEFPLNSLIRLHKYLDIGYTISNSVYLDILRDITEKIDIFDEDECADQILSSEGY